MSLIVTDTVLVRQFKGTVSRKKLFNGTSVGIYYTRYQQDSVGNVFFNLLRI